MSGALRMILEHCGGILNAHVSGLDAELRQYRLVGLLGGLVPASLYGFWLVISLSPG
jgi:hypothetical protein